MQVRVEGIGISGECSKVTEGSGLIIITSGRGSNSRYYMEASQAIVSDKPNSTEVKNTDPGVTATGDKQPWYSPTEEELSSTKVGME